MIYRREAFKNGVKIKSEVCAMYLPEPLSVKEQLAYLMEWNKLGAVGPIIWKYTIPEKTPKEAEGMDEAIEYSKSLGIWEDKQPKHFYFRPPVSEIREDMQKKIEEFHNRGLNE